MDLFISTNKSPSTALVVYFPRDETESSGMDGEISEIGLYQGAVESGRVASD